MQTGKFKLILVILIVAGLLLVAGAVRKTRKEPLPQKAPQTTIQTPGTGAPTTPSTFTLGPGDYTRDVPGWNGRPYDLYIPPQYDSAKAWPVVIALHGGGGNRENQQKMTCPRGNLQDPACLHNIASREGFIAVYPSGTANPLLIKLGKEVRTWNAGGGENGYSKVSKYSVEKNIDDVAYIKALLGDLKKAVNVDESRVYVTGISNGAAMSYRLACELSEKIAAIAPVAGGDQFSATKTCSPLRPVPIIHFHGTEDMGWPFNGGKSRLADDKDGVMVSIPETIKKWAERNGCVLTPERGEIPDKMSDGTSIEWKRYTSCRDNADVILYKIKGGGHTWPSGWEYWEDTIFEGNKERFGKITRNISVNELMWEFFKKHSMGQ